MSNPVQILVSKLETLYPGYIRIRAEEHGRILFSTPYATVEAVDFMRDGKVSLEVFTSDHKLPESFTVHPDFPREAMKRITALC